MVSVRTHHQHIAEDAALDRVNQAFTRLEKAWEAVRAQRSLDGTTQFDEAYLNELDAAEEEWLSAQISAFFRS